VDHRSLKRFNEQQIINKIIKQSSTVSISNFPSNLKIIKGIGDDAAYWIDNDFAYCTTTDALVNNVHFKSDYFTPYDIGRKSIGVNLSDIAAMGASPLGMLITLGIGQNEGEKWVDDYYKGVLEIAKSFNSPVLGGDLVFSNNIFISVTCFGYRELNSNHNNNYFLDRSKAEIGDLLYVTGDLGDSKAGLEILTDDKKVYHDYEKKLIANHLYKPPRINIGIKLLKLGLKTCIDVSDGLLIDSQRLAESSNVDIFLNDANLPVSENLKFKFPKSFKEYAMNGGEDYELLFTAPPTFKSKLLEISSDLKISITEIGKIKKGNGQLFVNEELANIKGWDHFDSIL
tara:strand:+ start:6453 stop:7481 length:1029 start_codon:yes stop_codon:yes gene_type:complete